MNYKTKSRLTNLVIGIAIISLFGFVVYQKLVPNWGKWNDFNAFVALVEEENCMEATQVRDDLTFDDLLDAIEWVESKGDANAVGEHESFEGFEVAARTHNGGPKGYKKESTKAYWIKVKERLETQKTDN